MKNIIKYYWFKFIKKLPLSAIKNSSFEKPSRAEARSTIVNTSFGRYSYCGYNCTLINCDIGRFCSISDNVVVGMGNHPLDWTSTSPAFYHGKESIPKNLANLNYNFAAKRTVIGNDVWIGTHVLIKGGIKIGTGAVIGMGSVVTKDVEPYTIVAGNPAKVIRKRFSDDEINKLLSSNWWEADVSVLKKVSQYADEPMLFLEKLGELK